MYRDNQDFHRRVLAGCMTGRRLVEAFGDLYDEIWWDNTNWRPVFDSKGKTDVDYYHMKKVLDTREPELVLCFGRQAADAMNIFYRAMLEVGRHVTVMESKHPNARYFPVSELRIFADNVRSWIQKRQASCSDHPEQGKRAS